MFLLILITNWNDFFLKSGFYAKNNAELIGGDNFSIGGLLRNFCGDHFYMSDEFIYGFYTVVENLYLRGYFLVFLLSEIVFKAKF